MALQKESQPVERKWNLKTVSMCARVCVCVCVDAAAAGSHFTLTMWNQGFPFLTTSNIKATWARSHSMMRFLFHFSDLTSILKTCLKALQ